MLAEILEKQYHKLTNEAEVLRRWNCQRLAKRFDRQAEVLRRQIDKLRSKAKNAPAVNSRA